MNPLQMILSVYQKFLSHLLTPMLGPWAVLLVGFIDASAFGIPLDPVVACYVYRDPGRALLYVLLVSLGSACGATFPYLLGRRGGKKFLLKRLGENRFRRVYGLTERFGALALFIPAILPPPTPFKLFEFSAGVARLRYSRFLTTVFAGRIVRFSILALLTERLGPQVVGLLPTLLRSQKRIILLLGAAAVGVALVRKHGARWREIAVSKLAVSTQPN
jgi:membrane protein YqaA with SNARE-associated domain